jgi:integrase
MSAPTCQSSEPTHPRRRIPTSETSAIPSTRRLFATAHPKIVGGHPHRFRDTFAVSLLLKCVQLPHVSILLGHASVKITERHYAPWVTSGASANGSGT